MPFKSEAQRRLMWAKHPNIARRWVKEGKAKMNKFQSKGTTVANNKPIGSAGQSFNFKSLMKEIPESRKGAITRRLAKKSQNNGRSGSGLPKSSK